MDSLDLHLTKAVYNAVNSNNITKEIPNMFGLLPYELYVIPGMFISILQVVWKDDFDPITFHLLPHFMAYSLFQMLKHNITRKRPGCFNKAIATYIDSSHCSKKSALQSFPSGHTGVAFALATALYLQMNKKNPVFFGVAVSKKTAKIISWVGFVVALMTSLHRISKGYHSVFDVLAGALLGSSIGYIMWSVGNKCQKKFEEMCEKDKKNEVCNKQESKLDLMGELQQPVDRKKLMKLTITLPVLFLMYRFLRNDLWKLATIKH